MGWFSRTIGILTAFGVIGCESKSTSTEMLTENILQPTKPVPLDQVLEVAGTRFPVRTQYKVDSGFVRVTIDQPNSVVDHEEYVETPVQFSLVEAEDTTYSPNLPLLRFPMAVGDTWHWSGKTVSFGKSEPASATIETSNQLLDLGGKPQQAVEIQVQLTIEPGRGNQPKNRNLSFWFAPGRGLLKRDFGGLSIRFPARA